MRNRALVALCAALLFATEAGAQWSAPSFLPPRPGDDIGVYVSSIENFGIQGIWRQQGNLNLGVRLGWIDSDVRGGLVTAAESWGLLFHAGQGLPIDVAWTAGVGAVFNDGTSMEVPVGLTAGRLITTVPVSIQLYAHPRLALILVSGDDQPDETELRGLVDLGADVVTAGGLKFRVGATLGTFDAIGVGLAMRWGRGVEVR